MDHTNSPNSKLVKLVVRAGLMTQAVADAVDRDDLILALRIHDRKIAKAQKAKGEHALAGV